MKDTEDGLCRWSFRIGDMQKYMIVGMCKISKVSRFEKWGWEQIRHGHYCIDSHGGVFSHSDA